MKHNTIFSIREEHPEDWYAAEYVAMKAFSNLHGMGSEDHYLIHLLRQCPEYLPELTRVAVIDGKIVGAIYYTKSKVVQTLPASQLGENESISHDIITFGPLCVDPIYQGLGIGKALMAETFELARVKGYRGIVIFGEPGYYPKVGFKTCDQFNITTSSGANFDAFMGYELIEDGLKEVSGKFYAAEAFDQLTKEDVQAYNTHFPYLKKIRLKSQWDFEKTAAFAEPDNIETDRLVITCFNLQMAEAIHKLSLDEDTKKFVPDEVFETLEVAEEVITALMEANGHLDHPQVYPVLLKCGLPIGYVQAVPINEGWEIGYHIGAEFTGNGYATEALTAFIPEIMKRLSIHQLMGICHPENLASQKVLTKCGFQWLKDQDEKKYYQLSINNGK